jgi:hypothetical protein
MRSSTKPASNEGQKEPGEKRIQEAWYRRFYRRFYGRGFRGGYRRFYRRW